jgi:hypothetical protein
LPFRIEPGRISICHRRRIESNFTPETFRQCIAETLLHSNYEGTDLEELARDVGFRSVDQIDVGKLAREIDLPGACDNRLVPDQKEHNDDGLVV